MQYKINFSSTFSTLHVVLDEGESIVAESGAMVTMSDGISIKTQARGGVLKALKRSFLGGESIFQNTFESHKRGAEIRLSPSIMGQIVDYPLSGSLYLASSSYLASLPSIFIDTKWEGLRGFFSGQGLFLLKAEGEGILFFNSYGAIEQIEVDGSMIIDTGHIVAFEPTLNYIVEPFSGIKSFLFSGEGLVCRFSGKGRVWIQTRKPIRLAEFLHPFRRVERTDQDSD